MRVNINKLNDYIKVLQAEKVAAMALLKAGIEHDKKSVPTVGKLVDLQKQSQASGHLVTRLWKSQMHENTHQEFSWELPLSSKNSNASEIEEHIKRKQIELADINAKALSNLEKSFDDRITYFKNFLPDNMESMETSVAIIPIEDDVGNDIEIDVSTFKTTYFEKNFKPIQDRLARYVDAAVQQQEQRSLDDSDIELIEAADHYAAAQENEILAYKAVFLQSTPSTDVRPGRDISH